MLIWTRKLALALGWSSQGNHDAAPLGWPGDEHALGELLETDFPPKGSDRTGASAVAHRDRHRRACGQPVAQRDVQLARRGPELRGPLAVDGHLGHRKGVRQVEGERLELGQRHGGDGGRTRQPVDRHLVVEFEFVAGHPVAEIAGGREVRVDDRWAALLGCPFCVQVTRPQASWACDSASRRASCAADSTARSGCPATGVDAGTSSPRITSEAGPTVAPAPIRAAGNATQCGPSVAPRSRTTVSIRMMRSWNRCVCTTHPRLTAAPSSSVTRSASGSQ